MTDTPKEYQRENVPIPDTPAPGEAPKPWGRTRVVGSPDPRVDAYERVSGTAVYPSDVKLPGMLYAVVLRCPHPNAMVKKVDAAAARRMPGVHAVLDGSGPEKEAGWRYQGRDMSKLFDPHCRFEGDVVAAVAAETPYQAADAARAIRVDYEVLPFVSEMEDALADGAPQVQETGNLAGESEYSRGDVEAGFAEADVVLEETYSTACEIHTPLEPHGCVARWDGDELTIWESTQGVYNVQMLAAMALRLPWSKVRVIGHYMGGGFGSKLQAGKYTVVAALLARETARPVKLFLSREETFLATGNRPPSRMRLKAGVRSDGTLTALEMDALGTGGAYPAGGTSLVDWVVRDLYLCPNVKTRATDVYTNAGPARPFRAPGHPQGAWALEQMMDALAQAIDMDPVRLRLKNLAAYSQAREGNPPYTVTGLKECLERGAEDFGWAEAQRRAAQSSDGDWRRGVGMAACLWVAGAGGPPSTIIIKLFADGSVNLNMGASDIGTGTKTVMAMVVAEELGVDPDMIQIEHADTGTTQFATASGGSKTVPTESPAVRAAAIEVKRQLLDYAAAELDAPVDDLVYEGDTIRVAGDESKSKRVVELQGLRQRGLVVGIGYRGPNPEDKVANPFAAQFCEVDVNTRTGEVKILRFLGAHDSGRVMNRLTYDNQVFGGITMGIGLAMTEERRLDRNNTGKMVNRNWHDYKLPTMMDSAPEMVSLPIEIPDDEANTTGAKGLGEPVTIPTAAAVANAIRHAVGIRLTDTPMSPMRLAQKLAEARKEG